MNIVPQSTRPFRIRIDSENDGYLRQWSAGQYLGASPLPGSTDEADRRFAYGLTLAGQPVSEASPYIDSTGFTTAPTNPGALPQLPLGATVKPGEAASAKRAGTFRDVVTLTIEPLS